MKKKSFLAVVLTLAMCFVSSVNVMAATGLTADEESILAKLKAGIEVNGQVVQVPASYLNQAENELMSNAEDVTAEQAAVINGKIDEVAAIAKAENITSAADLKNSASADQLVAIVKDAAAVVGYTVAYDAASGAIDVADPDGNSVFATKNVINQTGFDMTTTVAVGSVLVTLLAASIVIASKKKLFVKTLEA